ncbi:Putative ATP-dependent RNA helicase DDX60 [Chelonia mydas]|uniref:Putative ATP-dependent RNA helicase DDX60 n=1 Tax=Chelonia mydas TaxID=8469 RepID=M7AU30_CHEMY|nr:Putative ATP-dependent RNA helicase DDX60 [Chelonia mydas]
MRERSAVDKTHYIDPQWIYRCASIPCDDSAVTSLIKQKEFDEIRHWHSGKLLSDDYDRTKSSSQTMGKDPWALRSNQKLQSFLRFYGSSLEGNISKTIVTQLDTPKKAYSDMKNSKKINKTKAEVIIEENQKRMKAEEERKEQKQWDALSIEKLIQENFNSGISKLEDFLKKCQSNSVKCTAEMAGLNTCFEVWIEQCKDQGKKVKDINVAVEVMRRIHSLLEKYKDVMEKTDYQKIVRCLRYFGFDNLTCTLDPSQIPEDDRKEKKAKISKYAVGMGAARFQLQYMGHCLLREERTDRDPRIQHFIPDTWQRDLLDIVDNNESAVIVAPTSSGKTYASYYCMEKILKESNEGVVVYVAPTKALVNQVWATVYNRFNKTLPDGMVVCGVFTRDYRHDALNCQVLVTVPQCLEILLLSPHRQQWAKRIRYVIFDEVHCLGGEIGAEVWEHLLVMIRCPFLALSATISNPKHLTEWLQSVKRYWQHVESVREESSGSSVTTKKGTKKQKNIKTVNKSYKVKLVLYGERYNDLEKYVCSLEDNDFKIHHYHPCAALTVDHIDKYGFPSDLAFSPRESILLYDSMVQVWENWPRADELDPEKFTHFKNKIVITKADARKYEEELKEELKNWIVHDNRMKVVTATGTLALGINMPCKSVVFTQNSVYLDALNYRQSWAARKQLLLAGRPALKAESRQQQRKSSRAEVRMVIPYPAILTSVLLLAVALPSELGSQPAAATLQLPSTEGSAAASSSAEMSGRAGRRGQDLLGSVFFYDIPLPKVDKLIKSNVPQLRGQFPLNISLALRLMLLAAKADDKDDAKAKGYLDQEGNTMGFAGLVSHLHYHEPSNLVLVSFLVKGLFHKLCQPTRKNSKTFSKEVMEQLVLVLANLFGRRYIPASVIKSKQKFYQSKVFLEDLPEDFAVALHEYNNKIEENFGHFLFIISKMADMKQEYQLPLSRTDFSGEECNDSKLVSHLMSCNEGRTAVSPFACLSGNMDSDLLHAETVNSVILRTVGITAGNIPVLCAKKFDNRRRMMPLNAYALDFYKHGSLKAMAQDNGYVSLLNDFVESEFFVIDGDSLLLKYLCKKRQYLPFFYLVECFLLDFTQKGAKYVIVFFKDVEQMYFSYPIFLFHRTALIQHLKCNTDIVIHTEFSNCFSPEWQIFLKESYPYFVIISDLGLTSLQEDYLHIFIAHTLSKKINVVLTSGQESDTLRVYGYYVQNAYEHRSFFQQVCRTILLLKHLWPEGSDIRRIVCVLTCTVGLKIYSNMLENAKVSEETKEQLTKNFSQKEESEALTLEEAIDLCRMQCLSVVFLLHLPLSQRARIRIINSFTIYNHGLNLELGKKMKSEYQYLWNTVTKLAASCDFGDAFPVRTTSQLFLEQKQMLFKESKEEIPSIGLIPVKSDLVEDYAGAVLADLPILSSNDPAVTSLIKQTEFDELRHWHSGKPLSDDYDRTKCTNDAKSKCPKERRGIQKLQSYYRLYGRSLEGNISKTIVTQVDVPLVPTSTKAAVTKTKKLHKSKAEIIAEENQKRLGAKEEKKEQEQWSALSVSTESEIKENFTCGINRLENFLKTCQSNSVKFTAEMAGLNVCLEVWKEHCRSQGKKTRDLSIAVQVMRRIHIILEKHQELLKKSHVQKLSRCLKYLGFENLACSLSSQIIESDNEKITEYTTEMGAARFQLQYMGCYLFREERKDPDPRVQHFIPDTWQRELLDVVDNNESAVIVAPTSSGKTYASYYCMEKVLKESNEGVVVYVSPTKALVNQVMGTIYNRFTKTLPHGLVVGGTFTRDYRHDTLNCQILVTVPQCLEILLLSPHRQDWVKRIRYVIFDEIENYGIPSDTTFSPRESIQLYDMMAKVWEEWPRLQELDPEEFTSFKNKIVITKADAKNYEQELKKELINWIILGQREKLKAFSIAKVPMTPNISGVSNVFGFNIHSVEKTAMDAFYNLMKKQRSEQDPNTEKKIKRLTDKLRKTNKTLGRHLAATLKKQSSTNLERMILNLNEKQHLRKRLEKLTKVPPDSSYANSKAVDKETLMEIFHRIRFQRKRFQLRMLAQKGIGYHHASMAYKERQVVEMLFRMGYIRVVTATGSLALGINMPCKSVVFSEDSVFLDALNYRQMSGRAGRRGQDMIGSVFFYDIPLPKVEKLIKSNVPQLKGQFPLSISLVLRLMLLAAKADDKADARAKFLVKEGYLDQEGNPMGFTGLVTHLHYHEPSNFVLVSFLVKGLFHKLCQPVENGSTVFSEDVMEQLVLVLANLFGRRYLPACATKFRRTSCQSKVFLEDLPEEFAAAVHEYNCKIEKNFGCFLLTVAKLADMKQEYQLPLSKIDFTHKECDNSELTSHLMNSTKSIASVSPFTCLSGTVDQDLFDAENVNEAVLRTIGVNVRNAPLCWLEKYDNQGRRMPLNAYALDFFKHGSLIAVTRDNWYGLLV